MNCDVVSNPDISGVGVRLSFYIQTFIGILLVDRQSDPGAVWTFIATSFGLTIAAIIQDAQDQLSLFQALQVSNLVWLANFGSFLALASYSRGKTRRTVPLGHQYVRFATMLQTILSMALTFYMWITSATFGNQPGCDVKYVLFAINVRALGSGRIVGLTFASLLTASYLLITAHELRSYWAQLGSKALEAGKDQEIQSGRRHPSRRTTAMTDMSEATATGSIVTATPSQSRQSSLPLSVSFPDSTHRRGSTIDAIPETQQAPPDFDIPSTARQRRRPRRRNWFADFDPMLLGLTICQVVILGYFVVSSELLRVRNRPANHDDSLWGFGQILALIVVAPSLVSLIGAFREHGFRRLHRRKKNRRRLRKVTAEPDMV